MSRSARPRSLHLPPAPQHAPSHTHTRGALILRSAGITLGAIAVGDVAADILYLLENELLLSDAGRLAAAQLAAKGWTRGRIAEQLARSKYASGKPPLTADLLRIPLTVALGTAVEPGRGTSTRHAPCLVFVSQACRAAGWPRTAFHRRTGRWWWQGVRVRKVARCVADATSVRVCYGTRKGTSDCFSHQ